MDKGRILRRMRLNQIAVVSIELTTRCNHSCNFCPRKDMDIRSQDMPLFLFDSILDRVEHERITKRTYFSLCGMGEPLLYPKLQEAIQTIHTRFPKNLVSFNTNCKLLRKETNMLLDSLSPNDILQLSISADNQIAYNKLIGGKLEQIEENVRHFLREREKRHKKPKVFLRFIQSPYTDYKRFEEKWLSYVGNGVEIKTFPLRGWGDETPEIKQRKHPCTALWNSLVYDVEGNKYPCCRAYEYRLQSLFDVPKLKREQLHDIFSGVCTDCDFWVGQEHHIRFLGRWW